MTNFEVTVTQTYEHTFCISAKTKEEAERIASEKMSEHIDIKMPSPEETFETHNIESE